jgi:DNA-binding transcriptional LysR family regulator
MSDRLQELLVFVRATETGNFSTTARQLGLSQPSVSRIISELEARIGVKLLLRNTRRVSPTDAGAIFLERARRVLHDLDEADDAARGVDSLRGTLRVAMPSTFGIREVIPLLPDFLQAHPLLRIDLMTSDHMHDLVSEAADMAIRLGSLPDSAFGQRKLAEVERVMVASPGYLLAHGTPVRPSDLADHDCIAGSGGMARDHWSFRQAGEAVSVKITARVEVSSAEGMLACAREGLGIALVSTWLCGHELAAGQILPLFPEYVIDPLEVHAVFPAGRHPSQKVKVFTDYLVQAFANRRSTLKSSRGDRGQR